MKINSIGTLFLSGGGDENVSAEFDNKFISELISRSKSPRLLYIPLALNRDELGFKDAYNWFTAMLSKHNNGQSIEVEMCTDVSEKPQLNSEIDGIYLGGGNTFKLLKWLDETGFGQDLVRYYHTGGLIYGGSAGAIVLGEDIRMVAEENLEIGYESSKGLGLLSGASLICHYDAAHQNLIEVKQRTIGIPVWALPEDSGLVVTHSEILTFGDPELFQ